MDAADLHDLLHPAMLRLIGLGLRYFSTNASAVPRVKQAVRGTTVDDCQRLAWQAMKQTDAARTRELVERFGR